MKNTCKETSCNFVGDHISKSFPLGSVFLIFVKPKTVVHWSLIKAPLGDNFPFESKWPSQLTMWQGPLLPQPLRRLGLRAVVQTSRWRAEMTQPSLSIIELNICSRTGDGLQRGQCVRTLQSQRKRKEPYGTQWRLPCFELCNEETYLYVRYPFLPQSLRFSCCVLLCAAHLLEKRSDAFAFDPNCSKNRVAVLTDLRWWWWFRCLW